MDATTLFRTATTALERVPELESALRYVQATLTDGTRASLSDGKTTVTYDVNEIAQALRIVRLALNPRSST